MKKGILVTVLVGVILMLSGQHCLLFGFSYCNDLECSFSEHPEKTLLSESVITGSIHFLKAKIYVDSLLYEFEKSALEPFDVAVSLDHLEKAISELEIAKTKYAETIKIAQRIGYNQKKSNMFKSFDYEGYRNYNKYNHEISQKVINYLSNFDVIGVYQKCVDDIEDIQVTQALIKEQLKAGATPNLPDIWKIMQQYCETCLFGNYASAMGRTVLGNCNDN